MSAVCCLVSRIAINSISFLYLTLHSKKQAVAVAYAKSFTTNDIRHLPQALGPVRAQHTWAAEGHLSLR